LAEKRKKKNKNFFVGILDQRRRLEVREKARNVFCEEPTLLWPQGKKTPHFHQVFFDFVRIFLAFFARISYIKFGEFKEFNKAVIPFALVGYETGYGLFTKSYPTSAHGIIVK